MSNKTKLEEVEKQKPGEYTRSDVVLAAEQELADYKASKPSAYESVYGADIDALLRELTGRQNFSYDLSSDPLYRQYSQSYATLGRQAASDAAADASALTGGYGNSYAATAAAQASDAYLNKLGDVLPDLYSLAMDRYKLESDTLAGKLSALQTADKTAYTRWANDYDDWFDYLEYLTGAADSAYKKDYNEYTDRYDAWTDWRDYYAAQAKQDEEMALAREKLAQAQAQWEAEQAFAREQWQAEQAAGAATDAAAAQSASSKSGSSTAAQADAVLRRKTALRVAQVMQKSGRTSSAIEQSLRDAGYSSTDIKYVMKNL